MASFLFGKPKETSDAESDKSEEESDSEEIKEDDEEDSDTEKEDSEDGEEKESEDGSGIESDENNDEDDEKEVTISSFQPTFGNSRDQKKSLEENSIIQNSMLLLELGIQIKQGWQFLCYCQNAIEKNCFFHFYIPFFHTFCMYTHF